VMHEYIPGGCAPQTPLQSWVHQVCCCCFLLLQFVCVRCRIHVFKHFLCGRRRILHLLHFWAPQASNSQYTSNILLIFKGFASAAGPLRSPAAQQIGGLADCCSVEAVEDSSFVARLVCKGSLVGCLLGWLIGWLVGWLAGWLAGWLVDWLVGWLVGWLAGWLIGWLAGWLAGWLVG
jgi:hypothetical protein